MSRLGNLFGLTLLAFFAANCCLAQNANQIRWAPDLESARKAATQFKVPLLIHFYGDNCLPCKTLEQRVFTKPELIETLNKYFICVQVNGSQDRQVAAQYQVHSWPTDVFVGTDGSTLYQGVCPQDLKGYMSVLQNVAVMNRDRNLMLAAQQKSQEPMTQTTVGSQSPKAADAQARIQHSSMYSAEQQAQLQEALEAQRKSQQEALQNIVQEPTPGLPTATGSANASTSFAANPGSTMSTLGASTAPANNVTSGPLTPQNQPQAVHSTIPVQTVAAPGAPSSNNQLAGQLPERNLPGQIQTPAANTAGQGVGSPSNYTNMPTMSPAQAKPATVQPKLMTAAAKLSQTTAQTLDNPYFPSQDSGYSPSDSTATTAGFGNAAAGQAFHPAPATVGTGQAMPSTASGPTTPDTSIPVASTANQHGAGRANQPKTKAFLASHAIRQGESANLENKNSGPILSHNAGGETQIESAELTSQDKSENDSTSHKASAHSAASGDSNSASNQPASNVDSDQLGLEGYCPIALKAQNQWIEGKPEYAVKHRGKVYWMNSDDAMQKFLAAPDDASPVLSGYDPLILLEQGKLVDGSIQFGLHEQVSDTYLLFSSAESKQKYWENFDHYSKALNALLEKVRQNTP